jgi:outer membrane protein TolC
VNRSSEISRCTCAPATQRTLRRALTGVLLAGACQAALGQSTAPLSLDEALRRAEQRSGQLVARHAAMTSAREMAVAAGRLPDPVLKAGLNNVPVTGPDAWSLTNDFMTMRSIGVMQEFTRAEKRGARAARFEREGEAEEAARSVTLANIQRATATAWLERYYRERIVELLRNQRREAELQVDAAQAAYRGGRGGQADVVAAHGAVALIDDRIRQAASQLATSKLMLARWAGETNDRPLGAAPSLDVTRLSSEHLESDLEHHPELAAMVRQEDVARAEAEVARADERPDWSVELMYSQRGPAYSNMVSLNVSVPLPWDRKNRQQREVLARLAKVDALRAQREEATREHLADTRRWLQEWQSNRERLLNYDRALIPLAAERTVVALAAYRGATSPLSAVLEARRAEIEVQIERLRLEMETAALWAQLEYLIPATALSSDREK